LSIDLRHVIAWFLTSCMSLSLSLLQLTPLFVALAHLSIAFTRDVFYSLAVNIFDIIYQRATSKQQPGAGTVKSPAKTAARSTLFKW
jgi:hypothetical protein